MIGTLTTQTLRLDEELDLAAAAPLKAAILACRGEALQLDASAVQRLGGLCLQVLLAAAEAWRGDGLVLEITGASEPFVRAWRQLGADQHLPVSLGE